MYRLIDSPETGYHSKTLAVLDGIYKNIKDKFDKGDRVSGIIDVVLSPLIVPIVLPIARNTCVYYESDPP